MQQKFKTQSIALLITQRCTLNCNMCGACIPLYVKPKEDSIGLIKKELDSIFKLFEYVEIFEISGGEPLMHKDIVDIVKETLKYINYIGTLRITTNGTLLPSEELLKTIEQNKEKMLIKIDNYGDVSTKCNELIDSLKAFDISYRIVNYSESEQYCDGWVDLGDFTCKNYSKEDLRNIFDNCHSAHWMCLAVQNGKMHQCPYSSAGHEIGHFYNEHLDLLNDNLSNEQIINFIDMLGNQPCEACKYCNGFDVINSPRFAGGMQIKRKETVI